MKPVNVPLRHDEVQEAAAPHNIEAEQALLGAILINNDALHRVIGFLQPQDFFEPIHRDIYDVVRTLVTTGKVATPITLKSYLPAEMDIAGMTLGKYLARLAAEATTIINTIDYGRADWGLAARRALISAVENARSIAFHAPRKWTPRRLPAT